LKLAEARKTKVKNAMSFVSISQLEKFKCDASREKARYLSYSV
jgi:hypothetical protein